MGALGKLATIGLALLLSGLAGACAPSTPDYPRATTAVSLPRATPRAPGTPQVAATFAVPSPVPGPFETPGGIAVQAIEEDPAIASLLSSLSALGRQLNGSLTVTSDANRIRAAARQASDLTAQASRIAPRMSAIQQQQMFLYEASLAEGLVRVLGSREDVGDEGPTVPEGAPQTANGVLLDVRAMPPAIPISEPQSLARDLARVVSTATDLAKGKPASGDVTAVLTSLQWRTLAVREAVPKLPAQDVQQLAAGVAAAMQASMTMVEAHLG